MLSKSIDFITALSSNNNRLWFSEHKDLYLEAKAEFEDFAQQVLSSMIQLDPNIGFVELKDCVYRIYRDIRFSPDKTPYKRHFAVYIANGGRKSHYAGYYFHLQPDNVSFCCGGVYMPNKDELKSIREDIEFNWETFEKLINNQTFKNEFSWFNEHSLKTIPKGFDKNSPAKEWLRKTEYAFFAPLSLRELTSDKLLEIVVGHFKNMISVNDFFNRAISLVNEGGL